MSKRKGLSLDEKRERMLQLYQEEPNVVFQLKELEKEAPKKKGIVWATVKDVNQSLVDDSLVHCEKIGTSNYFWAFPSESQQRKRTRRDALSQSIAAIQADCAAVKQENTVMRASRLGDDDRAAKVERITRLQETVQAQRRELRDFTELDGNTLQKMQADLAKAMEAANVCTDNVFSTLAWLKKKFEHIDQRQLRQQLGITEDFDYLE